MTVLCVIIQILVAPALVFFVLLHSGRGGGLSDMFGGALGATASATSVGERNLDRITVVLALVFAFNTAALALLLA